MKGRKRSELIFHLLMIDRLSEVFTQQPKRLDVWSSCVFICNDHGQALGHWLDTAAMQQHKGSVAVLHVDAHNDLDVPKDPSAFSDAWLHNRSARQAISAAADLADYQLHAVWAGLVDRIAWLRPGDSESIHSASAIELDPSS